METKTYLKLFDPGFILKIAFLLLGFSLIFLGEIFLIGIISNFWGLYFTLALVASLSFIGLVAGYRDIIVRLSLIKEEVASGYFVEKSFIQLAGTYFSVFNLIVPGFFTDFIGLLGFFPIIKLGYGKVLFKLIPNSKRRLYESMKLYD